MNSDLICKAIDILFNTVSIFVLLSATGGIAKIILHHMHQIVEKADKKINFKHKYICVYLAVKMCIAFGLACYATLLVLSGLYFCLPKWQEILSPYMTSILSFREVMPEMAMLFANLGMWIICFYYQYLGFFGQKKDKDTNVGVQWPLVWLAAILTVTVLVAGHQRDLIIYLYVLDGVTIFMTQRYIRILSMTQKNAIDKIGMASGEVLNMTMKSNAMTMINLYYEFNYFLQILFIWYMKSKIRATAPWFSAFACILEIILIKTSQFKAAQMSEDSLSD